MKNNHCVRTIYDMSLSEIKQVSQISVTGEESSYSDQATITTVQTKGNDAKEVKKKMISI
jgi:hypothetical protein